MIGEQEKVHGLRGFSRARLCANVIFVKFGFNYYSHYDHV